MRLLSMPLVSVASTIVLVGSVLVAAGPAGASPEQVSEIGLAAGSTPRDVAPGSDGSMWVTGGDSKTIARVRTNGAATAFALPLPANVGNPWGIAAGPDGNVWFTLRDGGRVGRMTMQGAVSFVELPDASMRPQDIAAGPDGNMWFTELGGRIGRVTMAGAVRMFDVPWAKSRPHSIVQGPTGSNRMYFTDAGADRIAFVLMDGTTYGSVSLPEGSGPTGVANVDGAIWFAMTPRNQLGKLVADATVLEMAVPGGPTGMASGSGGTMWVSLPARNAVAKFSAQGAPLGEFRLTSPNSGPAGLSEGPDSNLWVAQTTAGKVARVLSGRVPQATAAPTISPSTGVRAGATLTASDGTWDFTPTSFTYQWQACTNASDTKTCANIPGATTKTFVPTASNVNQFLRVSVQGVNASGTGSPSFSSTVGVGVTAPPVPTAVPTPVSGGESATIAPGVTLTLNAPVSAQAGRRATFSVTANTVNIKGRVRLTIVDATGRESQVIAKGRWLRPTGASTAEAVKGKRVARALPAGTYTVRAQFTPSQAFRDNYPVTTLSKAITIGR